MICYILYEKDDNVYIIKVVSHEKIRSYILLGAMKPKLCVIFLLLNGFRKEMILIQTSWQGRI